MSGDRISVRNIPDRVYLWKMNGIDIREYGSGNAGTTNALRVLGKKAGVIVLLGDVAKTVLAVVLVKLFLHVPMVTCFRCLVCMLPPELFWDIIFRYSWDSAAVKELPAQRDWC